MHFYGLAFIATFFFVSVDDVCFCDSLRIDAGGLAMLLFLIPITFVRRRCAQLEMWAES